MRNVEPQRRSEGMFFVFGAEHALGDVAASARLGPRIPCRPPLHAKVHKERKHRKSPDRAGSQAAVKVRQECERIGALHAVMAGGVAHDPQLQPERLHASDSAHRHPRQDDDHRHLQHKLKQVGHQHAPQTANRRINSGEGNEHKNTDQKRRVLRSSEGIVRKSVTAGHDLEHFTLGHDRPQQHGDDADHGVGDPSQNQAVHDQPQINGLETSQESRGPAAIADFSQLHIGKHLRASPVAGKEKHGEHAAEAEAPPDPVPGNALGRYQAGDQKRSIGGEGGGHHRCAGQPPRDIASRDKEFLGVAARSAAIVNADRQIDQQIPDNHQPVDFGQRHRSLSAGNLFNKSV